MPAPDSDTRKQIFAFTPAQIYILKESRRIINMQKSDIQCLNLDCFGGNLKNLISILVQKECSFVSLNKKFKFKKSAG